MGRKDASATKLQMDQYRKQIGKSTTRRVNGFIDKGPSICQMYIYIYPGLVLLLLSSASMDAFAKYKAGQGITSKLKKHRVNTK